ncbi:MAG: hypothetical protein AB7S81_01770 [Bdellovibrionales bacterium]
MSQDDVGFSIDEDIYDAPQDKTPSGCIVTIHYGNDRTRFLIPVILRENHIHFNLTAAQLVQKKPSAEAQQENKWLKRDLVLATNDLKIGVRGKNASVREVLINGFKAYNKINKKEERPRLTFG